MVIFVKKDNKTNLWYVQNAMVIAGHGRKNGTDITYRMIAHMLNSVEVYESCD